MIELLRTVADNTDFKGLVALLDADLAERDGEEHGFYHQYNGLEGLNRVVVAYFEGKPIGCGALKFFDQKSLEIKRMYTLPDYRGKGIAGRILGELESWAVADGFGFCILETGKRNPEAVGLYRKYGYREIPNFGPYVGVDNSMCFQKSLTRDRKNE